MSVSYRILPDIGLVYIRYDGLAVFSESETAFRAYHTDPLFHPAQKHLVDLSRVTGLEADYMALFRLQAEKAAAFLPNAHETVMVYYAPTDIAADMARLAIQTWPPEAPVIPMLQRTEAEALSCLGFSQTRFSDLLQTA